MVDLTISSGIVSLNAKVKSEDIGKFCEAFSGFVESNLVPTFKSLETFEKKLARKVGGVSEAKELINDTLKAAYKFVDTVDDLFYYGSKSDFKSMKDDIRKGDTVKLFQFIAKVDEWIKNIAIAYTDFMTKCTNADEKCTECAESCSKSQAEAKAKKRKAAAIGGIVTLVTLGGGVAASVVAGVLTFGIGGIVGLSLTAAGLGATSLSTGTATLVVAYNYEKVEGCFKSLSCCFRDLAKQGSHIKHYFDDMHNTLKRYENNHTFLDKFKTSEDADTLCQALEKLQEILKITRLETDKARKTLADWEDYTDVLI